MSIGVKNKCKLLSIHKKSEFYANFETIEKTPEKNFVFKGLSHEMDLAFDDMYG
jgi:hypothetical protein